MKRLISVIFIVMLATGCAHYEHNQIRAEQAKQEAELDLPEWATTKPKRKPLSDAANGAAWWIGAEKIKELLR